MRPELTDTQKAKKKRGVCITLFCMKPLRKDNKGKCHGNLCCSCDKKRWQKNNPLKYTYGVKRRNAKAKKKYFALTFEEFKEFAEKNDYMRKKGTSAKSMQINRKRECTKDCPKEFCKIHGYYKNNIEGISLSENRWKYSKHMRHNVPDEFVPF